MRDKRGMRGKGVSEHSCARRRRGSSWALAILRTTFCETGTFPEIFDDSVAQKILRTKRTKRTMRTKGGLVLKASAIAPENTRDMRGKGPAGGKSAPYAP
jgi:hypothetical protein